MVSHSRYGRWWSWSGGQARWWALLVACLLAVALPACATAAPGGGTPTRGAPTPTSAPFAVTGVDLSVTPVSIAGMRCGSNASFTYTAVFHVAAGSAGGTIHFAYTLNNGRSQTDGTVTAGAGETRVMFTFSSSGALAADHTYPGTAIVMVTSPNSMVSPQVKPSGVCAEAGATGPFRVTGVTMAVSPTSIAGMGCGTPVTVTYTAVFQLAANGPGGTVEFAYTVNNGRGSTQASLAVAPGQTRASYAFRWSGNLPADHTYPEPGGVMVTSPNALTSSLVGPSGTCS